MSSMEYRPHYLMIAVIVGSGFWFFDSSVHYFFYDEPEFEWIPSDFNELWMRTTIIVLILSLGLYSHISTKKIIEAEHEKLRLQQELNEALERELNLQTKQAELTKETVMEMHNIVNNFLNNLLLFKIEAEESKSISKESLLLFDQIVQEATTKVRNLGEMAISKTDIQQHPD